MSMKVVDPSYRDTSRSPGSKNFPHRPDSERWPLLRLAKVDMDSVPYGSSISHNGRWVWAAYHDGAFVCAAASRDECRSKYRDWHIHHTAAQAEAKRKAAEPRED